VGHKFFWRVQFVFVAFVGMIGGLLKRIINAHQRCIYNQYRIKYQIDPDFQFMGRDICFSGAGAIILGKGSYMGDGSSIQAMAGARVEIGENCSISHNVRIYTCNLDANQVIRGHKHEDFYKKGDVIIGNNCWIGANVFIKENVRIGDHCVIAANSLVTRDVPAHSVAMGVPAKVIKYFQPETDLILKSAVL
jgi:maltose O-acetyltransferase